MIHGRSTQVRQLLDELAGQLATVHTEEAREQVLRMYNRLRWITPWTFHRCPYTGSVYARRSGRTATRYLFRSTLSPEQRRIVHEHYPNATA